MRWRSQFGARAVDGVAAAVLAAAVGFAAFALGAAMLAFVLAPIAFVATCAVLGRVDGEPLHRMAEFKLQALDAPRLPVEVAADDEKVAFLFGRSAADDAGRALSAALAELKNSLR